MAIIDVKVPELSESVSEASLLQWKKRAGEMVQRDEVLIEIETDKIVLEVPAAEAGVITEILMKDGATVKSGEVIAKIDTQAGAGLPSSSAMPAVSQAAVVEKMAVKTSAAVAMPAAAKLLAEHHLQADKIVGSGKGGRITKGDVLDAISSQQAKLPVENVTTAMRVAPPMDGREEVRQPMSKLRSTIAQRLLESQQNMASLTTFNEVNMAAVMGLRKRFQDSFTQRYGVKLGFMSFFVKAVVHALKKFPVVNASIDGNDMVYHNFYDIGIAIGSPRGLVVPVLRDADKMNFAEIELKIAEFAERAKEGKLSMAELSGGTFTITNGGTYGSMMSTPIINPPQSAILGIHATKDRAVVENGQVVVRPMCYLALSYDHRLIDGRESVLALVAIKEALESPERMLIDL